jgi:hypothetical protein
MEVSGLAVPVPDPRLETAAYYKKSGLKVLKDVDHACMVQNLIRS